MSLGKLLRLCLAAAILWSLTGMAQERVVIVGSGSNVPLRLYQAWATEFNGQNTMIQVRYLPLGTSESIQEIGQGIGDFGGGEVPLTDQQMHGPVALIPVPMVLVGIVPIYNLPGNPELNFSGELLAQIYLGNVKNWADPRIARLNPAVHLPELAITIVHRTPGKGSNYMFTNFLSKTSGQFRAQVGTSPSPRWPFGLEANRGEDMVEKVATVAGAIGYVEVSFARNSRIRYGRVENSAGSFVSATAESIEAACTATEQALPDDLRLDITNAPSPRSYPLASFTWIYVPTSGASPARRNALKQFLNWSLRDGQKIAKGMGYAPLPEGVVAKNLTIVNSLP